MTKREKIKYLLAPAIGFGIGGALWGLFHFLESTGDVNLFGAALIGLIGTSSLVLLSRNIKFLKKIFIILSGGIAWLVVLSVGEIGFTLGTLGSAFLIIISTIIFPGLIISLFYALILRSKIWPVFWRGLVGFILAPIIILEPTNLIGNIFSFILIGIILGLFLGWGLYRGQKFEKIGGRKREKSPEYEKNLI